MPFLVAVVIELVPGDQGKRGQRCSKFRFVLLHKREKRATKEREREAEKSNQRDEVLTRNRNEGVDE